MKIRLTSLFALLMGLVLGSWGGLHGQEPNPNDGRMREPGMMAACPMMGGRAPAGLLRQREHLELTETQVERLEALAASGREAMRERMAEMMRAHADLMDATAGDIDLDAARTALERSSRVHTEMVLARLRARQEARQVLTPEQRTRVDAMAGSTGMQGMGSGMGMHRMMGVCPMMRRMKGMMMEGGMRRGMMPDSMNREQREPGSRRFDG